MNKRLLSNTGIALSPIGLGGWQFANKGFSTYTWNEISQGNINNIVSTAIKNGINWFDTAQAYGESETRLAHALSNSQINKPFIMTKWSPRFKFANNISVENSIKNLSPFDIAVFQIHVPNSFSSIEKQVLAMANLLKQNKIAYIGTCNFSAKQLRIAHNVLSIYGIQLVSNQCRYNLLKRDIETNGILSTCRELGITPICFSPLEKGILTGVYNRSPDKIDMLPLLRRIKFKYLVNRITPLIKSMELIAEKHKCSLSNIAISWILYQKDVLVLTGVSNPYQLNQNMKIIELDINDVCELNYQSSRIRLLYV